MLKVVGVLGVTVGIDKMEFDGQGISLTEENSLESAAEVMSVLQMDKRLPNGREDYMRLLEELGFQSNQGGGEQHTQFVFQGQCLIVGDAKVGKTSLKKSLMGKPFDSEEPGTKGVEVSVVDREWNDLDGYSGLTFGDFRQFKSSAFTQATVYGLGEKITFNVNSTSKIAKLPQLLFPLLWLSWIVSVIYSFAFSASVPLWFYMVSLAAFLSALSLHQLHFNIEFRAQYATCFKLFSLLSDIPFFFTGLGMIHILVGDCKGPFECLMELIFPKRETEFRQGQLWKYHLFIFAILVADISVDGVYMVSKYFNIFPIRSLGESQPLLPGQGMFVQNSVPRLPRIVVSTIPLIAGISCGVVVVLSTEKSIFEHFPLFSFSIIILVGMALILSTLYATDHWFGREVKQTAYILLLISFCSDDVNMECVAFSLLWFYSLNKYSEIHCSDIFRESCNGVTILFIEKVILNFYKLRSAMNKKFSSLKLKLLDFAGDVEHSTYHHIFVRRGETHVVVFNIKKFLDEKYGTVTEKIRRIHFWLESIYSKTGPKSPIFLVGTHRGHFDQSCLTAIDAQLHKYLRHLFIEELAINEKENLIYFPIENSLERDGVENLKRQIMATAEQQKAVSGRNIPYSWIKIQDAIINLRQNTKAKFCVTKQMFPISVGNFICSNWSLDTLRYFHEKGLVIYADKGMNSELSNWILLKPDLLIDIAKTLVTPMTSLWQSGWRYDCARLYDKGMLANYLLEKILSRYKEDKEALQLFLEEYDIICPLFHDTAQGKEEEQVRYFVPSLLPISTDPNQVWLGEPDDKKFYVFFHGFLPEPLFCKLLSRAHKLSKVRFREGQTLLSRNDCRFWLQSDQSYRLSLLKDEDMIEVTFANCSEGMKPTDILGLVFTMVEGICKSSFPFVKFHCGPACPCIKCPGYQDCLPHPGEQSSRPKRRHVFNILPARLEQRTSNNSFYCVNKNFRDGLKEWEDFKGERL
ncbi:uncharacterized protein LOC114975981 [Acropora millepora]|uniref:uncharacterized protein LOC114975981 n=1 Tax=Acropora millepora TaxID=45264 RepID=UPI001CF1B138|nr:uncharacterized protein LOC114975981 [Acropora millepora]